MYDVRHCSSDHSASEVNKRMEIILLLLKLITILREETPLCKSPLKQPNSPHLHAVSPPNC